MEKHLTEYIKNERTIEYFKQSDVQAFRLVSQGGHIHNTVFFPNLGLPPYSAPAGAGLT